MYAATSITAGKGASMDPVLQKFRAAALVLARSGTVKERLHAAYRCELADLDADILPEDVRGDFLELRNSLMRERPSHRGEDAVTATIRKLSASDADQLAGNLIDIFARLSGAIAAAPERSVTALQPTAQVIPLFAVAAEA